MDLDLPEDRNVFGVRTPDVDGWGGILDEGRRVKRVAIVLDRDRHAHLVVTGQGEVRQFRDEEVPRSTTIA